jgi:hypothetical protein
MDPKDVLVDGYSRIPQLLGMALDGLTAEQLAYRPNEEANSVAWLAWHLTRVQDKQVSDLAGREQAWIVDGWHARFDKPADPDDTGQRYTAEQVASLRPADPAVLLDYNKAVQERTAEYIRTLQPADLDRELNEPRWNPLPTVGVRLVSILSDNLQHSGQALYLRGCIEGKHWHPA